MTWCIYKHTNKTNGKVYIGQTCQKPEDRWQCGNGYTHNPYFYAAIRKYDWQTGFTHEIIEEDIASQKASIVSLTLNTTVLQATRNVLKELKRLIRLFMTLTTVQQTPQVSVQKQFLKQEQAELSVIL